MADTVLKCRSETADTRSHVMFTAAAAAAAAAVASVVTCCDSITLSQLNIFIRRQLKTS